MQKTRCEGTYKTLDYWPATHAACCKVQFPAKHIRDEMTSLDELILHCNDNVSVSLYLADFNEVLHSAS